LQKSGQASQTITEKELSIWSAATMKPATINVPATLVATDTGTKEGSQTGKSTEPNKKMSLVIQNEPASPSAAVAHKHLSPLGFESPQSTAPGPLHELHRSQDLVWKRHRTIIQSYFTGKGLPKAVWSTKIAIQDKGFRSQAQTELQVAEAKHITGQQVDNGAQDYITDISGTSLDTGFRNDALWELASTQLWLYYEGGQSWDQLGWIPGGYLRIQVTRLANKDQTALANIMLEFGNRAFTAEGISMPRRK
jgi:hypothetical protein